jgi:hypothetical protein
MSALAEAIPVSDDEDFRVAVGAMAAALRLRRGRQEFEAKRAARKESLLHKPPGTPSGAA